jgi:hypothetical protein
MIPKKVVQIDLGLYLIIITRVLNVVKLENKHTNQIFQTRKLENQRTKEKSSTQNKQNINQTTCSLKISSEAD